LTPERFARVEALFDAACRLAMAERDAFLARHAGEDAEVLAALRALLAEDARASTGSDVLSRKLQAARADAEMRRELLDKLAAAGHPGDAAAAARSAEGPGTRVGPYRLLQQLGEGGFGVVFLAEQERPVVRQVALKIIKLGMDTRQVVARFEQERQALALMDHPNIARVLDAGATETGRPYFVMDLVKGVPIVEYSDRNHLTIDDRLGLFSQVCSAVQHAHGKGIIHRDLKPSNILVGSQDGSPLAKVIDFGIAKATSKLTDKTLFTEQQQVIGTLAYMSPEQAEGSLDIDTRSDIYSLGVLLYELLTGSTPFDTRTLNDAMYGEVRRLIREVDPPRPSTRLSQDRATLANIAARRRVEPERLGSLLRGELDWIVMKTLEKDRTRRYETASALAADIQRYLAGEAVVAAPPSAAYRLRKFVRRHKSTVAAALAVATALLLGLIGFAWQAAVARDERDRAVLARNAEAEQRTIAEEQRHLAEEQRAEAKARADELKLVADFQAGMLAQVDPTKAGEELSADVTSRFAAALSEAGVPDAERPGLLAAFRSQWRRVNTTDAARAFIDRTILQPAVAAIDRQFKDQPLVDAQLRQVLADRYHDLGLFAAALPLQRQALAIHRRVLGEAHRTTLGSVNNLGLVLLDLGELAEAERCLRDGLDQSRRVLGELDQQTMHLISNLGLVVREAGQLDEAEPLYRESLQKAEQVFGKEHEETVMSLGNLAMLLLNQGKPNDAEPFCREALSRSRRVLGEEHRYTLACLNNLAGALQAQGKLEDAEQHLREALAKSRAVLGDEHPETIACTANLGALLHAQGKLAEAEACLRDALQRAESRLGSDSPETVNTLMLLASVLAAKGALPEAEAYLRQVLDRVLRVGEDEADAARARSNLGNVLQLQGKLDEAESLLRQAIATRRQLFGDRHPDTLGSVITLGSVLLAAGRHKETLDLLLPAQPAARDAFPDARAHRLAALLVLVGKARHGLGELAAAETELQQAHALLVRTRGEAHAETRDCARALAALYTDWHAAAPGAGHDLEAAEWQARGTTKASDAGK